MSEDKVFNLMEKMYIEFSGKFEQIDQRFEQIDQRFEQIDQRFEQIDQRFEQIDQRFEQIDQRFDKIDQRLDGLDHRVGKIEIKIENDICPKIQLLFEGQKQMQAQLDRIEEKVEQHDEIIIKRVK